MKLLINKTAFSLVEVVLSLGITAFCLLSLLGLLIVGIKDTQTSVEQTMAASLAKALAADLRNTPSSLKVSSAFSLTIPDVEGVHTLYFNGAGSAVGSEDSDLSANSDARYRATLSYYPPAADSVRNATSLRILITWPALADPTASTPPVNYMGAYEVITALGRN